MQSDAKYRKTGSSVALEVDGYKNLFVTQGGKYAAAAQAGRIYNVANQAAVAMTAALATTYTGLAVGNPLGSGKNLSMIGFGFGNTILGISVGTVGLMGGASTTVITAAITPQNAKLGGGAGVAVATGGQTIGTPILHSIYGQTGTAPVNIWPAMLTRIDLEGSIVVPPGYFIAVYHFMLSSASLQFSLSWEEVDE